MSNFKFPYFSRNIGEFWRRWHISLSTWFRDYLYIPLGGSMEGRWKSIRNIFIIFLVSGFWHGANWTFIFWGFFHSILFLPSFIFNTNRNYTTSIIAENTFFPSPKEFIQVGVTFILVTIGWVFFRSETIGDSLIYLNQLIFDFQLPNKYRIGLVYVFLMFSLDFFFRKNERIETEYFKYDWVLFSILILIILEKFGVYNEFIYFQF